MNSSIMYGNSVTNKIRRYLAIPRPCFDGTAVAPGFLLIHFLQKPFIDIRTFFTGTCHNYFLLCKICRLLYFRFFLVLSPNVCFPHGLFGDGIPIPLLPSPPPCGCVLGFCATPRTVGRIPMCLLRPAFPMTRLRHSSFPTCPIVARHAALNARTSPEGSFNCTISPSLESTAALDPALRIICAPCPG